VNRQLIPVADLVPHDGEMMLLDAVEAVDEITLTARVVVRCDGLLDEGIDTLPAIVGLEYMAQAVAAWSGWHARRVGAPVRLGFLLGSRSFSSNVDTFRDGAVLRVDIEELMRDDNGMAVFKARVTGDGVEQTASLSVFQPNNVETYLEEQQT